MRKDLLKFADAISMSFDIPDAEKEIAEEALARFEASAKALDKAVDYLDMLKIPFEKYQEVSNESVVKKRGVLSRFQREAKDKFEKFKLLSVISIRKLNHFSKGDADIKEIINTYESAILELESKVEEFFQVIENYNSNDFRNEVLNSINVIKDEGSKLIDLIYDRIIKHINNNLIGKDWMTEFNSKIKQEDDLPKMLQLYKERQHELENGMANTGKEQQALNPSDAQRIYYADQQRNVNFTEFQDKE